MRRRERKGGREREREVANNSIIVGIEQFCVSVLCSCNNIF